MAWILSIIIATLPITDVFHSYIPDRVLLTDNPFVDQPVVSLEEGRTFLLKTLVYYSLPEGTTLQQLAQEIESTKTWNELANIYNNLPEQSKHLRVAARYG